MDSLTTGVIGLPVGVPESGGEQNDVCACADLSSHAFHIVAGSAGRLSPAV